MPNSSTQDDRQPSAVNRSIAQLESDLSRVLHTVGGASEPPPSGGRVAAAVGALAAALTRMVAGLTTGRPKYAPVIVEMRILRNARPAYSARQRRRDQRAARSAPPDEDSNGFRCRRLSRGSARGCGRGRYLLIGSSIAASDSTTNLHRLEALCEGSCANRQDPHRLNPSY